MSSQSELDFIKSLRAKMAQQDAQTSDQIAERERAITISEAERDRGDMYHRLWVQTSDELEDMKARFYKLEAAAMKARHILLEGGSLFEQGDAIEQIDLALAEEENQ